MEKKLRILGLIALVFGLAATMLSVFSFGIFFALLAGLFGMIISGIYIAIDIRNEINKNKITPGVIAMFLSSVPILLLLGIIILSKINS